METSSVVRQAGGRPRGLYVTLVIVAMASVIVMVGSYGRIQEAREMGTVRPASLGPVRGTGTDMSRPVHATNVERIETDSIRLEFLKPRERAQGEPERSSRGGGTVTGY